MPRGCRNRPTSPEAAAARRQKAASMGLHPGGGYAAFFRSSLRSALGSSCLFSSRVSMDLR